MSPLTTVMPSVSTSGDCRNMRMECWSVVAAPRASWSMITLRFVCALAVSATKKTTTVNGTILFRPMAVIDPLVVNWLLINCGRLRLAAFRRQDTCGTNGAYSSPARGSQGKTEFLRVQGLCRNGTRRFMLIADVIIRGCLWAAEKRECA